MANPLVAAGLLTALCLAAPAFGAPGTRVTFTSWGVTAIDGRPIFPIGFTMPPPPDGKAPNGKPAMQEMADAGATFIRTGAFGGPWNEAAFDRERAWHDAAAKAGLYCCVWLREASALPPGGAKAEALLRRIVTTFKDSPALFMWKGEDEPAWGKKPVEPLRRAYDTVHALDPNHPVQIIQAPRSTVDQLRAYNDIGDLFGADIYPVSYPPGVHGDIPNKEISLVGDYTRKMMQVVQGKKPVWMTLQIAFSGTVGQGKTLRMPTFPEERFMVYEAIIDGVRGLTFFGGHLPQAWNAEDARLGWNWRFWDRVLKPVIQEIGAHSPLYPALLAPDSRLPVRAGSDAVEVLVREVGSTVYVLACKREGPTVQVDFTGLPDDVGAGEVLYEEPRKVEAKAGRFRDWFGPFEVHVYRFGRTKATLPRETKQ